MSDIADQQEINRLNALVETLVRERDEARAFIEGLEYSDDPEVKYSARAFMDKVHNPSEAK